MADMIMKFDKNKKELIVSTEDGTDSLIIPFHLTDTDMRYIAALTGWQIIRLIKKLVANL